MDLTPYTCRGFHGDFDRLMRDVPVAGIDLQQTHSMIRVCAETRSYLYDKPGYSPTQVRYCPGSRPRLEAIATSVRDRFNNHIEALMHWVHDNIRHPNYAGNVRPDRAFSEEDLIESRVGWCNEQCRVFIALCQVLQHPSRLCFLFHANGRSGHTACEVYERESWQFYDVTHRVHLLMCPTGVHADEKSRRCFDKAYADPLKDYYDGKTPPIDINRGGEFFRATGICNYLIEGVEAISYESADPYVHHEI